MKILAAFLALAASLSMPCPVHADPLTTQDYIDIGQLYSQYNQAIDSGDAEGWAATFTPDGSFNRFKGREALVGFVQQWHAKMKGGNRRHWNTGLRIVPAKQGASGSVYLMLLDVSTRPASIASTGMYTDALVKTAVGWRFKSRTYKPDIPMSAQPAKP